MSFEEDDWFGGGFGGLDSFKCPSPDPSLAVPIREPSPMQFLEVQSPTRDLTSIPFQDDIMQAFEDQESPATSQYQMMQSIQTTTYSEMQTMQAESSTTYEQQHTLPAMLNGSYDVGMRVNEQPQSQPQQQQRVQQQHYYQQHHAQPSTSQGTGLQQVQTAVTSTVASVARPPPKTTTARAPAATVSRSKQRNLQPKQPNGSRKKPAAAEGTNTVGAVLQTANKLAAASSTDPAQNQNFNSSGGMVMRLSVDNSQRVAQLSSEIALLHDEQRKRGIDNSMRIKDLESKRAQIFFEALRQQHVNVDELSRQATAPPPAAPRARPAAQRAAAPAVLVTQQQPVTVSHKQQHSAQYVTSSPTVTVQHMPPSQQHHPQNAPQYYQQTQTLQPQQAQAQPQTSHGPTMTTVQAQPGQRDRRAPPLYKQVVTYMSQASQQPMQGGGGPTVYQSAAQVSQCDPTPTGVTIQQSSIRQNQQIVPPHQSIVQTSQPMHMLVQQGVSHPPHHQPHVQVVSSQSFAASHQLQPGHSYREPSVKEVVQVVVGSSSQLSSSASSQPVVMRHTPISATLQQAGAPASTLRSQLSHQSPLSRTPVSSRLQHHMIYTQQQPSVSGIKAPSAPVPQPVPPPKSKPIELPKPDPVECAKRIEEKKLIRAQRLRDGLAKLSAKLEFPETERPFSSMHDVMQRLVPYGLYHEPDVSQDTLEEADSSILRSFVNNDSRMSRLQKRLNRVFYREAMNGSDHVDRNLMLFLDVEYEKRKLEEEKQSVSVDTREQFIAQSEFIPALRERGIVDVKAPSRTGLVPKLVSVGTYDYHPFCDIPPVTPRPPPSPSPPPRSPSKSPVKSSRRRSSTSSSTTLRSPVASPTPPRNYARRTGAGRQIVAIPRKEPRKAELDLDIPKAEFGRERISFRNTPRRDSRSSVKDEPSTPVGKTTPRRAPKIEEQFSEPSSSTVLPQTVDEVDEQKIFKSPTRPPSAHIPRRYPAKLQAKMDVRREMERAEEEKRAREEKERQEREEQERRLLREEEERRARELQAKERLENEEQELIKQEREREERKRREMKEKLERERAREKRERERMKAKERSAREQSRRPPRGTPKEESNTHVAETGLRGTAPSANVKEVTAPSVSALGSSNAPKAVPVPLATLNIRRPSAAEQNLEEEASDSSASPELSTFIPEPIIKATPPKKEHTTWRSEASKLTASSLSSSTTGTFVVPPMHHLQEPSVSAREPSPPRTPEYIPHKFRRHGQRANMAGAPPMRPAEPQYQHVSHVSPKKEIPVQVKEEPVVKQEVVDAGPDANGKKVPPLRIGGLRLKINLPQPPPPVPVAPDSDTKENSEESKHKKHKKKKKKKRKREEAEGKEKDTGKEKKKKKKHKEDVGLIASEDEPCCSKSLPRDSVTPPNPARIILKINVGSRGRSPGPGSENGLSPSPRPASAQLRVPPLRIKAGSMSPAVRVSPVPPSHIPPLRISTKIPKPKHGVEGSGVTAPPAKIPRLKIRLGGGGGQASPAALNNSAASPSPKPSPLAVVSHTCSPTPTLAAMSSVLPVHSVVLPLKLPPLVKPVAQPSSVGENSSGMEPIQFSDSDEDGEDERLRAAADEALARCGLSVRSPKRNAAEWTLK